MLTQKRLKEILHYNQDTGVFTRDGKPVGGIKHNGYVIICICSMRIEAHKLAFLYMTGAFYKGDVDHINHVRNDNRWINLRVVTRQENMRNAKRSKINTSGCTGVTWDKVNNKWMAQICISGKCIKLGRFFDITDAVIARKMGEYKYGFHKNHGLINA